MPLKCSLIGMDRLVTDNGLFYLMFKVPRKRSVGKRIKTVMSKRPVSLPFSVLLNTAA